MSNIEALRRLEPGTLRLLAVRSNQLSYETLDVTFGSDRFKVQHCLPSVALCAL